MKTILPVLVIISIFFMGFSQEKDPLTIDDFSTTIFSPVELKGILSMIYFVDSMVIKETGIQNVNEAYHTYFEKQMVLSNSNQMLPALLKDSIKFSFFDSLDKKAVESIWNIDDYIHRIRIRDTSLAEVRGIKTLSLNTTGSYMDYLKKVGETDKRFMDFAEAAEISGDISPSTMGWFPMHHNEFDFKLFKDRLFATVFLLRMGDSIEEKVNRYLNLESSGNQ